MAPKVKITKEDILNASLIIVREQGIDAINARAIAKSLKCSTQPVFSNYATMEDLKNDIINLAQDIYIKYSEEVIKNEDIPKYKASGLAYIRFAKDESELFKLLFMRDKYGQETEFDNILSDKAVSMVSKNMKMSKDKLFMFHIQMWVFVHGIATMIATSYLKWDDEMISKMMSDEYLAVKSYYEKNK